MSAADGSAELGGFLEAAGRSLEDAARSLAGAEPTVPVAMALSDAEITVKVAVEAVGASVRVRPIGTRDLQSAIRPEALSEVRVRFVAAGEAPSAAPPRRPSRDVIGDVERAPEFVRLGEILGPLRFEASFVPGRRQWIVTVQDASGRAVRDVFVDDAPGAGRA
ncbi:MAG: hypothetical protein ACKVVT_00715 [Dehalococcoidia bacterium]